MKSDKEHGLYGPGHNSFTKDEEGRDIIVYHARTTDKLICEDPLYDPNRHTMKRVVEWDENGMPVFQ